MAQTFCYQRVAAMETAFRGDVILVKISLVASMDSKKLAISSKGTVASFENLACDLIKMQSKVLVSGHQCIKWAV